MSWLWLAVGVNGFAQAPGYRERFRELMQQGKRQDAEAVVARWTKARPRDPDLYVARFNLLMAGAEVIALRTTPAKEGELQLTDQKSGQVAGSIGSGYNPVKVQQAMQVLREGIALAPDRLDMRFGLAKAAELNDDARQQLHIVAEALAWRQAAPGRTWRWRDGQALPSPETEFVPVAVEEYMVPYWTSDTPAGYQQALALAELLLRYYPASSLGYFNKGNYYAFTHNDAEAYKWFAEADQRNPDDPQLINNLLRISLNLKKKAAAQGYLARLRKYPDFAQDCQRLAAELEKL